ncbi:hypothetical protein E2C01_031992 [Portunus trituberculatus]|uniref:Uncharacterized protein n=1 Tax=Portunus trituberculatus TaxID=210409 RepID=A0A5B7EYH2_PORTR|nr:hypothetical protein [Portunus trituberculatus]
MVQKAQAALGAPAWTRLCNMQVETSLTPLRNRIQATNMTHTHKFIRRDNSQELHLKLESSKAIARLRIKNHSTQDSQTPKRSSAKEKRWNKQPEPCRQPLDKGPRNIKQMVQSVKTEQLRSLYAAR